MSELKDNISQMNIRCQMNLLYTLCRCIADLMKMSHTSQQARDTLIAIAEAVMEQAAILLIHVEDYANELSDS